MIISSFPAIQLLCFFERTTVAGGVPGAFNPGVAFVPHLPRVTQILSLRDFCSPPFHISSSSYLFCIRLCPAGPFLLQSTKRKKKSCQSHPSSRLMFFFFPGHLPEYPQKTAPANAGPDYFDWPPLLFTFR